MSETTENTKTEEKKGIKYDNIVSVLGTKESVYVEEYVSDILGPTDCFNVTPIILEKEEKEEPENKEDLRNIAEQTVYFVNHEVSKPEVNEKGWLDFLFNDGLVEKTSK